MNPCIATLTLSGHLLEKLSAAAAAGFGAIELVEQDFIASGLTVQQLRRHLSDLGLALPALQPCRDIEGLPEPERSRAFARASRQLDLAADLGAQMMLVCSSVSPLSSPDPDRAAADLAELADMAAARGLRIGYEALSWGVHVADHAAAWDIVRRADHPALGVVLDSFHTLATGTPTDDIAAIPADRIFLVQISDAPHLRMDILRLSRHLRRLPGLGDHDLPRFLAAVKATGYAGPISVEVFSDALRGAPPAAVARDAMLSLKAVRARMAPAPQRQPAADGGLDALLAHVGVTAPSLTAAVPAAAGLATDHLILRARPDAARHAMLRLATEMATGWRDLTDLPDPDGPIRLARLDSDAVRLLMATPAAVRADAHGSATNAGDEAPTLDVLCLSVPDILATAAALQAGGHALLPVSPTHLAIAGPQQGLDEDEAARLTAAQVMLDVDDSGSFRQICLAHPVGGSLIAFAERRGGYRGFGLANAALWLPARRALRDAPADVPNAE